MSITHMRCGMSLLFVLFIALPAGRPARAQVSFQGLGDLPGGSVVDGSAAAVSADGSVVVGSSRSANGGEAFRWTRATGMVGLGDLPGGGFSSGAQDVSADGSVVVGRGQSSTGEAFRWTAQGGMVGIGQTVPGTGDFVVAEGVSGDGSVAVGSGFPTPTSIRPYRWTVSGGASDLGGPNPGQARSVSDSGAVVTGHHRPAGTLEAFRWTPGTGLVGLGFLPGRILSDGIAVSADGSTIVGFSSSAGSSEAFRWTAETGMVGMGFVPGQSSSQAYDASADGSVIVGTSGGAMVWDEQNGMRSLESILTAHGVDLTGWRLQSATGVSADGRTIVGNARNPAGDQEGFIAVIPEPAGLPLVALAGLLARRRRRQRGR